MKIPVELLGKQLLALVDTGASASLIRSCHVDRVDPCQPRRIVGLGGATTSLGSVSSIVQISGISSELSCFLVVQDSCLAYDVVLGSDFFLKNRIVVGLGKYTLGQDFEVGWTSVHFADGFEPQITCSRLPVYASADIRIPAGESVLVPVCCSRRLSGEVFYSGDVGLSYLQGVNGVASFEGVLAEDKTPNVLMSQSAYARNRVEVV